MKKKITGEDQVSSIFEQPEKSTNQLNYQLRSPSLRNRKSMRKNKMSQRPMLYE